MMEFALDGREIGLGNQENTGDIHPPFPTTLSKPIQKVQNDKV